MRTEPKPESPQREVSVAIAFGTESAFVDIESQRAGSMALVSWQGTLKLTSERMIVLRLVDNLVWWVVIEHGTEIVLGSDDAKHQWPASVLKESVDDTGTILLHPAWHVRSPTSARFSAEVQLASLGLTRRTVRIG